MYIAKDLRSLSKREKIQNIKRLLHENEKPLNVVRLNGMPFWCLKDPISKLPVLNRIKVWHVLTQASHVFVDTKTFLSEDRMIRYMLRTAPKTAEQELSVIPLNQCNKDDVEFLDNASNYHVSDWLEHDGICWGAYLDCSPIGYCTIGFADNANPVIADHELYREDAYQLSDVFVVANHRRKDYGTALIRGAIAGTFNKTRPRPVFLIASNQDIEQFYAQIGFKHIDNTMGYYAMVLEPGDLK